MDMRIAMFLKLLILIFLYEINCSPIDPVAFVNEENALENQSEPSDTDMEQNLIDYLDWYYETYVNASDNQINSEENNVENEDIYDRMQSDQAAPQDFGQLSPLYVNLSSMVNLTRSTVNQTDIEYIRTMRNRTKDAWIQTIKNNLLRQVGRMNASTSKPPHGIGITGLNITQIMPGISHDTMVDDEYITEKIRSYYPSCELPKNTDQDVWKDENTMNLYFNVENPDSNSVNIATATLRLYRIPSGNESLVVDSNCENSTATEDQLMRISIYWYTKSLKRQRVKRRLSDSKVIGQSAKWVELSVLPATKAWVKGKNLGLAILVEDQEGTVLKADKYFKGASCMVGTSTPKPIPTVIVDAARWTSQLERSNESFGRNSTTAFYNYISLLPTVDICTIEFPENSTQDILSNHKKNACDLRKIHFHSQKLGQNEFSELIPTSRHIRHQKHNMHEMNSDIRSRIVDKRVIMTNEELRNYNARLANASFPNINR